MNTLERNTAFIKRQAAALGFDHCGIAQAVQLDDDARRLEQWLNRGMHGSMRYMEHYFDKRIDPRKLVDNACSVITLLLNYYPEQQQVVDAPRIAKYAYGQDYHEVIKGKLNTLLLMMQEEIGEVSGRGFIDSAPVLERSWAQRSGLGWIGKNGNLIHKQAGSFFFIATLITDLPLLYDSPTGDYCGSCTRCLDACPTDALVAPGVVDGSRCISYYTIELKELLIPENMQGKFENWMFGCDICQDVCPWNRFSRPNTTVEFTPLPAILNFSTRDWEDLTEEEFRKVFRYSPLKRSKYGGIRRNLKFIQY
ncbi:tRNA epoxyqueuosine(34) reductase QueG [Chitinophaga pendula]|uniref:tRNA epoxyqueuosine(34) reductase QueG n=1 Tax=Chitinophaga TaxID=79328 RepID=UPI000BB05D88|nr:MULTISPECIES: tRNA epoxyqueuosine(34) reductase QueG [Chitinophaga]ASZ13633.1 tRNA epoxyqueuosine(34) reductase QueG [Chitinophaga sp. MD30]UCJ08742.1 tRNA epoxyqueuosine(34) reductase QueG [Chitinophaga pendula]